MKLVLITLFATVAFGCAARAVDTPEAPDTPKRQPLLLELFTSEGCSSCPPAEKLLAKFQETQPFENAEVITLAFHVDYWDYLGWKDKYASPLYTQRQRVYGRKFRMGGTYTPQMVVDGRFQFVGSREKEAEIAVQRALKTSKANIDFENTPNDQMRILANGLDLKETSTLYLAVAEDNISSRIKRGENAGKNLKHVSVVRSLKAVRKIEPGTRSVTAEIKVDFKESWSKEDLKLVGFIQENKSRGVLATLLVTSADHTSHNYPSNIPRETVRRSG